MTENQHEQEYEKRTDKSSPNKVKRIIITSIIVVVVLILAAFIYYITSQKSAIGQVNDFSKAVNKKDYQTLSDMLSTNKHKMTTDDMKYFVDYINEGNNKAKFDKEIDKIKRDIKSDKANNEDFGQITDNNGRTIIKVRPNGKKLFFFDKVSFEPNLVKVYVKDSYNNAEYQYLRSGKQEDVLASGEKQTEIGSFMVGKFDLDTTKTFKDTIASEDKTDGQLHVDTDKVAKNGKIYASEKFDEAWFKVKFKNAEKLDDSKSLYIDGTKTSYDDKVYGKFAALQPLTLSAKGQIGDDTVKTNTVDVESNKDDKPQTITLAFDKSVIEKHEKKEKEIQDDAQKFMNDYTDDLNRAYKDGIFEHVENYFEEDSDVAKYIKKKVNSKNKSKYTKPKIKKFKREGNDITIILEKQDKHHNNITSEYKLKYKKDSIKKFKITSYTDI